MKNVLPLVQPKVRLTSLAVLIAIAGGITGTDVLASAYQIQVAQAQQAGELKDKFFDLIITGKFKISDLEAAVKSVVYNEDFKYHIIRTSGVASYQTNINNSRQAVEKKTKEVFQAQQAINNFFDEHQDFISSLNKEVRDQAEPIVTLNIPAQIKKWQSEQRQQDREWKCSGSSTSPICL